MNEGMKELMSERMKGEKIMKTTMQEIKMMVVGLLVLSGTMQAAAVDYKNTYSGSTVGYQSAAAGIQTTATAPSASFQSTSAMPTMTNVEVENTLNSDGTVNEEAYSPERRNSGPRRLPGNPSPVGDAVLPLMLLACAYLIIRARKRVRA